MNALTVPEPSETDEFAAVVQSLRALTRDHLLCFRLEVGRLLLDRFYGGDGHGYRERTKDASFTRFMAMHSAGLAEIGLHERTLRDCVAVQIAWQTLPAEVRERLGFTRVVELARVADPTLRSRLALAAVGEQWSLVRLKDTIGAAKAGLWFDTDLDQPGTQPPPLPEPERKRMQPGRLVSRAERFHGEVEALRQDWRGAAGASRTQRARIVKAIGAMREELGRLLEDLAAEAKP